MKHLLALTALLTPVSYGPPVAPVPLLSSDLDRVVQSRFGSVTKQDEEEGRLGVSRILEPTYRRKIFAVRSAEEREALGRLREGGWAVTMWVQPPVDQDALIGPIQTAQEAPERGPARGDLLEAARRAQRSRAPVQALSGGFQVEARPVPASSAECLRCHTRNRLGDPLGAVLYVFTPERK